MKHWSFVIHTKETARERENNNDKSQIMQSQMKDMLALATSTIWQQNLLARTLTDSTPHSSIDFFSYKLWKREDFVPSLLTHKIIVLSSFCPGKKTIDNIKVEHTSICKKLTHHQPYLTFLIHGTQCIHHMVSHIKKTHLINMVVMD